MAFDNVGEFPIQTNANDRAKVQIAGATSANLLDIDVLGKGSFRLFAGTDGVALGHVSDALKIDISSQGLAALKISRDGSAPTAATASFFEMVTGAGPAIVTASNPLASQLSQGGAVLSATNGLFSNLLQGNAVISATNGLFSNLLQGNTALSATNGLFANILQGNAVLAVANGLPSRLTDGTAFVGTVAAPLFTALSLSGTAVSNANPLPVATVQAATVGTILRGSVATAYQKDAAVAAQTAVNHNYTVPATKTLTLHRVRVSASGAARFDIILDAAGTPVILDTIHIGPGGGTDEVIYELDGVDRPTLATGLILRIVKQNNEKNQAQDLYSSFVAVNTP